MNDDEIEKLIEKLERGHKETGSPAAKRLADAVKLQQEIKRNHEKNSK